MSTADLQATRAALEARQTKLRDELAELIAEKDHLEEKIGKKREAREDHDADSARYAELDEQIKELVVDYGETREAIGRRRSRLEKTGRRLRRIARRLRNRVKPKVVDLGLRPSNGTRQTVLRGTVGHYTAGPVDDDDAEAFALWRSIDRYHRSMGWIAIGYPWGVTRDGTIAILRGRDLVGAHTLNHNTGWDGCSVHGTTGHTWTEPQRRAFRAALKKWGTIDKPVFGHKEMPGQSTACPGSFLTGYKTKGRSQ